MCHGSGCGVTFRNVTFTECTLVVAEGACAVLHGTSSSFDPEGPCGLALFADGEGTVVRMHGGSITGGTQGVTVQVVLPSVCLCVCPDRCGEGREKVIVADECAPCAVR